MYNIEDMTWLQGDRKFLFEYWKNISWVSAANKLNIFEHKKRNFVAPRSHVMFYLLYKHQWNTKPLFVCERCGVVAIATVIFSLVKATCKFYMWSYNVFARKLTLYFIGVYIINYYNILNSTTSKDNLVQTSVVIAGVADGIGSMSALFQSKLLFLTV